MGAWKALIANSKDNPHREGRIIMPAL